MKTDTFAIIGGDYRTVFAANRLASLGYTVYIYGFGNDITFDEAVNRSHSVKDVLSEANYVLLPLPYSTDGENINTILSDKQIAISDVLDNMNPQSVLFAGMIDKLFSAMLERHGTEYYDYFAREELTVRNAVPTAEGAIEIALRELPITVHSAKCLVLGYGRVAKVVAQMLKGIGANVSIAARKHSDLAWCNVLGYKNFYISDLAEQIHKFDVIFNTVPNRIMDREVLGFVKKDCLIIDLASKPGGVDFDTAKQLGLSVIWALSLPGKVAPVTAGNIITDTILNIIRETEVKK